MLMSRGVGYMKGFGLDKTAKQDLVREVKSFFLSEWGEELSDFRAAALVEFVVGVSGRYVYNQAVADAHKLMSEKVDDLYGLEKRG